MRKRWIYSLKSFLKIDSCYFWGMIQWSSLIHDTQWEIKLLFLLLLVLWVVIKLIEPARFYAICELRNRDPFPKNLRRESNIGTSDPFSILNFLFLILIIGLFFQINKRPTIFDGHQYGNQTASLGILFLGRWFFSRLLFFIFGSSSSVLTVISESNVSVFRWGYLIYVGLLIYYFGGFGQMFLKVIIALCLIYLGWVQLGVISKYFKQEHRSYLSFILYLCALKLAPWLVLFSWFNSASL